MDDYPSISPYAYCAWNPVNLIDPNGMDTIFSFATNTQNNKQNEDNKNILTFVRNEGDISGVTSVAMHGSKSGQFIYASDASGESEIRLDPDFFLECINQSSVYFAPDYNNNVAVGKKPMFIFYSCYTGDGQKSFAEQVSAKTNGIVIAPSGRLFVSTFGSCYIEDSNGGHTGVWNVFNNGKMVATFPGSQLPKDWISTMGGVSGVIDSF